MIGSAIPALLVLHTTEMLTRDDGYRHEPEQNREQIDRPETVRNIPRDSFIDNPALINLYMASMPEIEKRVREKYGEEHDQA